MKNTYLNSKVVPGDILDIIILYLMGKDNFIGDNSDCTYISRCMMLINQIRPNLPESIIDTFYESNFIFNNGMGNIERRYNKKKAFFEKDIDVNSKIVYITNISELNKINKIGATPCVLSLKAHLNLNELPKNIIPDSVISINYGFDNLNQGYDYNYKQQDPRYTVSKFGKKTFPKNLKKLSYYNLNLIDNTGLPKKLEEIEFKNGFNVYIDDFFNKFNMLTKIHFTSKDKIEYLDKVINILPPTLKDLKINLSGLKNFNLLKKFKLEFLYHCYCKDYHNTKHFILINSQIFPLKLKKFNTCCNYIIFSEKDQFNSDDNNDDTNFNEWSSSIIKNLYPHSFHNKNITDIVYDPNNSIINFDISKNNVVYYKNFNEFINISNNRTNKPIL